MLLDFTVGNYRSFHAKKTISLLAQKLKEDEKANVSKVSSYEVLKTLAVYGANSSGKSDQSTIDDERLRRRLCPA